MKIGKQVLKTNNMKNQKKRFCKKISKFVSQFIKFLIPQMKLKTQTTNFIAVKLNFQGLKLCVNN